MVTAIKTNKVICPHTDLCKNPDCMHYKPHDKIFHGDKPYQNCHDGVTICPLVPEYIKCVEVK